MNLRNALTFLSQHQPFPDDNDLDQETLDGWAVVRQYLETNPADECIPLLLNCFGWPDGCGTYCYVEDLLRKCDPEKVISSLRSSLTSARMPVRFWSCQVASGYKSPFLYDGLIACLHDEDAGVREMASIAVEQQEVAFALPALRSRLLTETDASVSELIQSAIDDFESGNSTVSPPAP